MLTLFLGANPIYANMDLDTIALPQSYQGTASIKVTGGYQSSIPNIGNGTIVDNYKETIEENGQINAVLIGNYLLYIPAIDNPTVTGTVNFAHHVYRDNKTVTTDIAPPQNFTGQNSQGAIGLYINYAKGTYTLSIGLGAEGESTSFDGAGEKGENQTKKRFELEKVELTLPLPKDLKVLKGNKIISGEAKTPEPSHKVLENKKTIEVAWEFVASAEKVALPKQIIDQMNLK